MKANEYLKEYGLKASREHLDWMVRVEARQDIHGWFMDDLKRLVEGHELVEKLGGLDEAKIYVPDGYKSERLKQAIADVESCQ